MKVYDPQLLQEMASVLVSLETPIADTCFVFGVYVPAIHSYITTLYLDILKSKIPEVKRRSPGERMVMDCIPQTSILWKHMKCVGTPKQMMQFTAQNGVVGVGAYLTEAMENAVGPAATKNIRTANGGGWLDNSTTATSKQKVYRYVSGWNPRIDHGEVVILK